MNVFKNRQMIIENLCPPSHLAKVSILSLHFFCPKSIDMNMIKQIIILALLLLPFVSFPQKRNVATDSATYYRMAIMEAQKGVF